MKILFLLIGLGLSSLFNSSFAEDWSGGTGYTHGDYQPPRVEAHREVDTTVRQQVNDIGSQDGYTSNEYNNANNNYHDTVIKKAPDGYYTH